MIVPLSDFENFIFFQVKHSK